MADDLFKIDDLPVIDPDKDYHADLVGEDKKYKDDKALARAAAEKDLFIERLKRENAGMRQTLSTSTSVETLLAKIEEKTKPQPQPASNHEAQAAATEPALTQPVDIEKTVEDLMNRRAREKERADNERKVEERLRHAYGENYQTRVKQEASKLGVGTEFLSELARAQPQAFLKLLNLDEERRPDNLTQPQNTFRPSGNAHGGKTWSHYETIRKTNPTEYYKPAIQNEMFKQLAELGQEDFYK